MKNIKLHIKTHLVSITLIAYSVLYLITHDTSSVKVVVYFTLPFSLAIANSLASFFPKKGKVIWVICYIFFAGLVAFDIYMDEKANNVTKHVLPLSGTIPSDLENTSIPQTSQGIITTENEQLEKKTSAKPQTTGNLEQQIIDVLSSKEFKKIMQEGSETGVMPDILTSFKKFQDYLVSQGADQASNIQMDNLSQYALDAFKKVFPDKDPTDLDDEMKEDFVFLIMELGYEAARTEFLKDPKKALWAGVRFDAMKDTHDIRVMEKSFSRWADELLSDNFGSRTAFEILGIDDEIATNALKPPEPLLPDIDEKTLSTAPAQQPPLPQHTRTQQKKTASDNIPTMTPEDSKPKNFSDIISKYPTQTMDMDIIVDSLRKDFPKERVDRAMAYIMLYGPEAGLQHLKRYDVQVAKIIEPLFAKPKGTEK